MLGRRLRENYSADERKRAAKFQNRTLENLKGKLLRNVTQSNFKPETQRVDTKIQTTQGSKEK